MVPVAVRLAGGSVPVAVPDHFGVPGQTGGTAGDRGAGQAAGGNPLTASQQIRHSERLFSVMRRLAVAVGCMAVAYAQAPVVGDVNLYGLRKVTAERILKTARPSPGRPIPPSKGDMEDNLGEIPGVVMARVEAVCCDGPSTIVFIGVEEKGAPHAVFRT